MRGPVISYQQAQELNARVQSKLAPYLFACCNYEPTSLHVLSEDGWFTVAIQDLYKFSIDASPVFDSFSSFLPYSKRRQFSAFCNTLSQIKMLRAVVDHNQSPDDGYSAQEYRIAFRNWVSGIIGRPQPESLADFAVLNQRLEHIAQNMLSDLCAIIDYFCMAPDKDDIISKWLKRTLYWYSHNTKTQYYFNQIANAYIARSYSAGNYSVSTLPEWELKRRINRWIEAALCKPDEDRIRACKATIVTNTKYLNGESTMFNALMKTLPEDKIALMKKNWSDEISTAQADLSQHEQQLKDLQKKIGTDSRKYLFSYLAVRLIELMAELDDANEHYTLLPQDILQRDVARLFDGVQSPENDF